MVNSHSARHPVAKCFAKQNVSKRPFMSGHLDTIPPESLDDRETENMDCKVFCEAKCIEATAFCRIIPHFDSLNASPLKGGTGDFLGSMIIGHWTFFSLVILILIVILLAFHRADRRPGDYRILQGIGPVTMSYYDSVTIYLAFAIGDSLDCLQSSIQAAHQKYLQITSIESRGPTELPKTFSISQNYPNPVNPATTIEFSLPSSEYVTLKIYNITGQEVATLVSERLAPGNHKRVWDRSGLASGVYFYKLEAGPFVKTKKLVLMK